MTKLQITIKIRDFFNGLFGFAFLLSVLNWIPLIWSDNPIWWKLSKTMLVVIIFSLIMYILCRISIKDLEKQEPAKITLDDIPDEQLKSDLIKAMSAVVESVKKVGKV